MTPLTACARVGVPLDPQPRVDPRFTDGETSRPGPVALAAPVLPAGLFIFSHARADSRAALAAPQ